MNRLIATVIASFIAAPVFADAHGSGDAEKGADSFKKCRACHSIIADDGTEIVKGGKTGPNLYGIVGRKAGGVEDFGYGDDLVAAGEAGLVWDAASFIGFVQDPREYLRSYLDDSGAKSKMSYKLKNGAEDIYAYLVSVGPQ